MIIDVHCHIGNLPDAPFAHTSCPENLGLLEQEMKDTKISAAIILPWNTKEPDNDPDTNVVLSLIKDKKIPSLSGALIRLPPQRSNSSIWILFLKKTASSG